MRASLVRSRVTYHVSRITFSRSRRTAFRHGSHIGSVIPVFVENAFNLSRHRVVFHDQADFTAAVQAHRANVLTANEEPAAIHHDALRVQLVTSELAHVIVRHDLVVGRILADYLYTASDRCLAQQQPDSLLVFDLRIKYSNRPFRGT